MTRGGQLRVNVWNSTNDAICLTPKTVLVRVDARRLWVKYLGRDLQPIIAAASEMESAAASIRRIITERFTDVGDFSEHPVNEKMQKLVVRSDEIEWTIPAHPGVRT